ncbi:caspase family protein [Actinoplanes sp. NPDC051861]|uniref:caspase family protein n=1 Tax=Actinoplanes sp. NPDC051861 TaxID=3155170 RepID=UPI0034476B5F
MAGARRALIVANDTYEHDGLRHLQAPAADAEALAGVLGDRAVGDFGVRVVHNEPAHVVQSEIEELFSESRADDLLLLHFSCHGLKSESGELFFAARNTRPNRLASTATSADFVQRCMRTSRARSVVLLLDCCYGGAFSAGVTVRAAGNVNVLDSFPAERPGGGRGRAVITASSAMEYAFEGDHLADDHAPRPSVFTSALVEGLATGDADRDQDGWVSLNELYDYVFDRVREQNPLQTPSRDVEMQGELYLAKRRGAVTVPSQLQPELQEAAASPLAGVRAAAVAELAVIAHGTHAGRALAARRALETLAADDSRTVSAAASKALGTPPSAPPPPPPPPPAPSRPEPAPAAAPRKHWTVPRLAGIAGLVALLLFVVIMFDLLGNRDQGNQGSTPPPSASAGNAFTATAPWRLVVKDRIGPEDKGCKVTLTNTGTGEKEIYENYGTKSYQMREAGQYSWTASHPLCLVSYRAGAGSLALPATIKPGTGDTDAFTFSKGITIGVMKLVDGKLCEYDVRDVKSGQSIASFEPQPVGGMISFDPERDSGQYYIADVRCELNIDTAP